MYLIQTNFLYFQKAFLLTLISNFYLAGSAILINTIKMPKSLMM